MRHVIRCHVHFYVDDNFDFHFYSYTKSVCKINTADAVDDDGAVDDANSQSHIREIYRVCIASE